MLRRFDHDRRSFDSDRDRRPLTDGSPTSGDHHRAVIDALYSLNPEDNQHRHPCSVDRRNA
jgi:hypothetical protein